MIKNNLSIDYPLPKDVDTFLEKTIFPAMKIAELNDDNIGEIADFICSNYEIPLSQGKRTTTEKKTLALASKAVTILTSDKVIKL
jgi:hypothetical protein